MSTAEDVFYLYERNSRYYYDCNLKKNEEEKCTGECYCHIQQKVKPFTIGDQDMPCDLKYKCYIRPGDECPICCEEILTKSSAFITNCGHHYHKKCLLKYMEIKWLSTAYTSIARCPMCRCSLGHPDFVQRYKSSYFSINYDDNNELDKLEDFWISIDLTLPSFCRNGYDHYLGMEKECFCCESYRKKGNFINEINQNIQPSELL
jgi:hypothetical protein